VIKTSEDESVHVVMEKITNERSRHSLMAINRGFKMKFAIVTFPYSMDTDKGTGFWKAIVAALSAPLAGLQMSAGSTSPRLGMIWLDAHSGC
jgi:hypothetical protein